LEAYLARTNLACPLAQALERTAREYDLGRIRAWEGVKQGYEDLNVRVAAEKGEYFVKFFNTERSKEFVTDYVRAMVELREGGVPLPRLAVSSGEALRVIDGPRGATPLCVMEFVRARDFTAAAPEAGDMSACARYLALMHASPLRVRSHYDTWGTARLLEEFERKRSYLAPEEAALIEPVTAQFRALPWEAFRRCTIHGDLQRNHILKDSAGRYTFIDLGCLDHNAAVVDLAIYLALFCLDPFTPAGRRELLDRTVASYSREAPVTPAEYSALDVLIRATYASYLLATAQLIRGRGDSSAETAGWFRFALAGLRNEGGY